MRFYISMFAIVLAASSTSIARADDLSDLFGGGVFKGKKLAKAIEEASTHPLGSERNPVRVNMPPGQRAYLARLRCSDGKAPVFERGGSVGIGPFGSIADVYDVDCGTAAPGKVAVYLDMYHSKHKERNPVPGFSLQPE